jgi:hypothetical protein
MQIHNYGNFKILRIDNFQYIGEIFKNSQLANFRIAIKNEHLFQPCSSYKMTLE